MHDSKADNLFIYLFYVTNSFYGETSQLLDLYIHIKHIYAKYLANWGLSIWESSPEAPMCEKHHSNNKNT